MTQESANPNNSQTNPRANRPQDTSDAVASPSAPEGTPKLDRPIRPVLLPLSFDTIEELIDWLWSNDELTVEQRRAALEGAKWDGNRARRLKADESVTRRVTLKPVDINRRVQRVWATGADLALFSSRVQAQPAYRLLIEMVHRLDHNLRRRALRTVRFYKAAAALQRSDTRREKRIQKAHLRQRAVVREAVDRFLDLVSPEVRTVYFRNEVTNRVSLMPTSQKRSDGLHWPEAMQGLSMFDDAPRTVLLDDEHDPAWSETELDDLFSHRPELPGRGRFAWREKTNKTWAFRIAWDRSRVAAFCSWREGNPKPAPPHSDSLDGLGMTDARKDVLKQAWSHPRVAELALRYLTGWLRSTGLHVTGENIDTGENAENVRSIITTMLETNGPAWGTLRSLLDNTSGTTYPIWTVNPIVQDAEKRWVVRHDSDIYASRQTPIVPGENDVLVYNGEKGSIAAQAACWDTPLLIDNLNSHHPHRSKWSWQKQDLPVIHPDSNGKQMTTRSELAALVPGRNAPYAVLVGEHTKERFFKANHLHRAQLIGMLAGACLDCNYGADTQAPNKKKQAQVLRKIGRSRANTIGDLLDKFTEAIRTLAKADLCYVLRYNPASRCFFAASIAADQSLLDEAIDKALPELNKVANPQYLAPLLSLALRAAIQPAGEGRSWEVYRRMHSIAQVDEVESKPLEPPLDFPFPTRLTIPLAAGSGAAADAVLWLRWRNTPNALLKDTDQSSTKPAQLAKAIEDRTGCVTATLAAALALLGPQSSP